MRDGARSDLGVVLVIVETLLAAVTATAVSQLSLRLASLVLTTCQHVLRSSQHPSYLRPLQSLVLCAHLPYSDHFPSTMDLSKSNLHSSPPKALDENMLVDNCDTTCKQNPASFKLDVVTVSGIDLNYCSNSSSIFIIVCGCIPS